MNESDVHDALAELMKAHLDEMSRTDSFPSHLQDRYTHTVTNEVLFFLEKYPERKSELYRRIREGRIMISPFLSNTMWGFQSAEGFLRSMYPANRLAKEIGIKMKWAVHSELPSLPQSIVPLLSGSGVEWIAKPYLNYDAHFEGLEIPPLFYLQGADSSTIKVCMDTWTSNRFVYAQGAGILKLTFYRNDTSTIAGWWLPHYRSLPDYPVNAALAEGTHFDLFPDACKQPPVITHRIDSLNAVSEGKYRIINSTFAMYADHVDSVEREYPFMKKVKGSFGISWEAWPAGMAKYVAGYREQERRWLMTEARMVKEGIDFHEDTALLRLHRRAEWCMGMLADHAWNGSDPDNIRENARVRKYLVEELESSVSSLGRSIPGTALPPIDPVEGTFRDTPQHRFENRFYTLTFDKNGERLESLILKKNGKSFHEESVPFINLEYMLDSAGYSFTPGPVTISEKRDTLVIRQAGDLAGLACEIYYLLYGHTDRVDIDIRIQRPSHHQPEALVARFGLNLDQFTLHAETGGAVIRPDPVPRGDLLPGADTTRTVVRDFVSAESREMSTLTIVPLDAFLLLTDGKWLTFELFGNNQNWREAIRDQNNETEFRFRFSLRASPVYRQEDAFAFSHSVMYEDFGFQPGSQNNPLSVKKTAGIVHSQHFVATCVKPAEPEFGEGIILRLRETTGITGQTTFMLDRPYRVYRCNLLEETEEEIPVRQNQFQVHTRGNGFICLRLVR